MPQGFIGDISLLTFKSKIAQALLHRWAERLLKDAVTAWVKTAESIIPVWSGASRGTLVKLGSSVGVNISIFASPSAKNAKTNENTGKDQSEGYLVSERGRYGFVYSTSLFHLAVNENADATLFGFHLINPGPYGFRAASDAEFNKVITEGMRRFPFRTIIGTAFEVKHNRIG